MNISIFTSMTNPELRMDPWKEALSCYEDFADEVVTVGKVGQKSLHLVILVKFFKKALIIRMVIGSFIWI